MKLFKKKKNNPIGTLTLGVEVKNCRECEHKKQQREPARWGYRKAQKSYAPVLDEKMCSACGRVFARREGEFWRYCPNCGARMEG